MHSVDTDKNRQTSQLMLMAPWPKSHHCRSKRYQHQYDFILWSSKWLWRLEKPSPDQRDCYFYTKHMLLWDRELWNVDTNTIKSTPGPIANSIWWKNPFTTSIPTSWCDNSIDPFNFSPMPGGDQSLKQSKPSSRCLCAFSIKPAKSPFNVSVSILEAIKHENVTPKHIYLRQHHLRYSSAAESPIVQMNYIVEALQ